MFRPHGKVVLQSRQQRSLTRHFSDVAEIAAACLAPGTVLDGELVVMNGDRIDFAALQRRATSSRIDAPATFVAFDLLAVRGEDTRRLPAARRRSMLEDIIAASATGLAVVPMTHDPAAAASWMTLTDRGIEGVVSKDVTQTYNPARYHWKKCRARLTSEAVIGGVLGNLHDPTSLILGRHDTAGRLRVIARSVPLQRSVSEQLAPRLLTPPGPHPWPREIPGGRVGLAGSSPPVAHTPVAPTVVVEIETDSTLDHGRYRHPVRVLRPRLDLTPTDLRYWPDDRTPR